MRSLRAARLVAAVVLIAAPAAATVLVPMRDSTLVETSHVVALATVGGVVSHWTADGRIVTDATLDLERVMKGLVDAGQVVVTVPGGIVDGTVAHVAGAPEFTPGERVVVFLKPTAPGRFRTNALALGAYHVTPTAGGRGLARRREPSPDARDLDAFCTRVEQLAGGVPETDAMPDAITTAPATGEFTFLSGPSRWSGEPVTLRLANTAADMTNADTLNVLQSAMKAWTDVASATIDLRLGLGATIAPSVAGGACDGKSVIQFDDPFGEVQDMVGCSGVLAVGGFCGDGTTTTVGGTVFHGIREADVTVNPRLATCFGLTNVSEVLTHELGHAIGLGHSADTTATMYAIAHFDGRGASLKPDDVAGVTALYPATGATTTSTVPATTSSTTTLRSTTTTLRTTTTTSRTTSTTVRPTTTTSSSTTSSTLRPTTSTSSSTTTSTVRATTTTSSTLPPGDADGDGIGDPTDACPGTPAGDLVGPDGCTLCPCAGDMSGAWTSHTAYVRCVRTAVRAAKLAGTLVPAAAREAVLHARISTCGRSDVTRCCVVGTRCRVESASACVGPGTDAGPGSCHPSPCGAP